MLAGERLTAVHQLLAEPLSLKPGRNGEVEDSQAAGGWVGPVAFSPETWRIGAYDDGSNDFLLHLENVDGRVPQRWIGVLDSFADARELRGSAPVALSKFNRKVLGNICSDAFNTFRISEFR